MIFEETGLERFNANDPLPPTDRKGRTFLPSSLESMAPHTMNVSEINEWDDFDNYMAATQQRKEEALEKDRALREENKGAVRRNVYSGYNTGDMGDLVNLIGRKNLAVKQKPEWSSGGSANWWLENKIKRAKAEDKPYWQKWAVQEADLDNNPETMDNVILFDNKDQGRIKAIDGYHFTPFTKKESQRLYYSAFQARQIERRLQRNRRKY
jgi:hypothetical protein